LREGLAKIFKGVGVDFMVSVVPTPLAFFGVEEELFLSDESEF